MIELKALQSQVTDLVADLRGQVAATGELRSALLAEYAVARAAERTAGTFETWLEDRLDQAAVAWVLGCVFVRFCEDNALVEGLWLGGPEGRAPVGRAVEARQAYLIANPRSNDRHWLRSAFGHLHELRATGKLFDEHNLVWRFGISGEAAEALSDFFRRGGGYASLRSSTLDTRFLGDLYQDLSAHARSTYALLQTPVFVEELILDRAFEPAVREFGLAATSLIDPTCGSGHFLLGAFGRIVQRWKDRDPATDIRVLVERALQQVTGVDANPFAVAIARFRLLIAALGHCGLSSLERAPHFPVRVATGDSLLPWGDYKAVAQTDLLDELEHRPVFAYATEDPDLLTDYLAPNQYTVVVGNPPYITVKDKAQNTAYRELYKSVCHRQYALSVPFAKRFFDLARRADERGEGAGWVGQITANSFMKREFGKKLIDDYFAGEVELTEVIDTSGAFIPGHGTPTVILVGRSNNRHRAPVVRTVLGVRGEPGQPEDPAKGLVWSAILAQIDQPGSESAWVSVADLPREHLAHFPWSLSGGGSLDLVGALHRTTTSMVKDFVKLVGRTTHTGSDDSYFAPVKTWQRHGAAGSSRVSLVTGEVVRDWALSADTEALFPYGDDLRASLEDVVVARVLWRTRSILALRREPGGTHEEIGLTWYEWSRWHSERFVVPLGIAMAFISTHNHFVLDRGGKVFNRSAPVIKLPEGATEDDHLRLLGVLNSSTACFWLKQVSHDKGSQGVNEGFKSQDWERFYEFTGTKLAQFPLPTAYPLERSRELDALAQRLATVTPAAVAASALPTRQRLTAAREEWHAIRARMIALQEELDWAVYRLYGLGGDDLTTADLTTAGLTTAGLTTAGLTTAGLTTAGPTTVSLTTVDAPGLALGERAFEIVLARETDDDEGGTQWFARHGSTPVTELPAHWPDDYRSIVERRIAVIESDRNIALVERPECKRRWAAEGWDVMRAKALRDWLLDRLEAAELWAGAPTPLSVAQLAERFRHDNDFRAVLDLWVGGDQHDMTRTLGRLVAEEHVPFLPADRYKPVGLRKRAQWERTWAAQRRADAGESVDIAVPPKYTSADFTKASYWRNRGKLDVPKERFISYPRMGHDADPSELLGWAGWDHLARAQAIATVYLDRKTVAGWPLPRLLPLLAGLAELEPWLHQWHAEPWPGFPGSPAQFFTDLVNTELSYLAVDRAKLHELRGLAGP